MPNKYPTSKRPCAEPGCALVATSSDPHVCAERLINIPYRCEAGHEFVIKLPAITDYERRQARHVARAEDREREFSILSKHDPAEVARTIEEMRREQAKIEREREENERQHAIVVEGMRLKAEADAANAAADAAELAELDAAIASEHEDADT